MKKVHTQEAPSAIGPYSQAVISGGFVYLSGQIPINPETGSLVENSIEVQAEQVCRNIEAVIRAAGSGISKVVKTTCFLRHLSDFESFNAVYERHFVGKPARSCVEVSALPKNALVEIEAVAELDAD